MLKECLEVFEKMYKKHGDKLIIDNYNLSEGTYILVKDDESLEVLEVNKNSERCSLYDYFVKLDYMSKYLSSNKALADKNIHSNNYLSFFIKKETLLNGKLTEKIIDDYFDLLKDPLTKYGKKKKSKEIYEKAEKDYGKVNEVKLERSREWIKNNLNETYITTNIKDISFEKAYLKNVLKVFFEDSIDEYEKESNKYVLPNIYNSNDYNIEIEGDVFGLHNNYMGLNAKKPFLEQRTRKNTLPYLIDNNQVLLQNKLFDYLNTISKERYIYFGDDEIYTQKDLELKDNFDGYFLRVNKGQELELLDYDLVINLRMKLRKAFVVNNFLGTDFSKKKDPIEYNKSFEKLFDIESLINDIFFKKFLINNYFSSKNDIKLNDNKLVEILLINRQSLFAYFKKGKMFPSNFSKFSLEIIKNSIISENYLRACEQFNLRQSIIEYFEGGRDMGDTLNNVKNVLREKINQNETKTIETNEEYYFAIGQLSNYLLGLSKSGNKNHSAINTLINSKTDERLNNELKKLFKKYNYAIQKNSKRFNNLYSMILAYNPSVKIDDELIIAGYLSSSLIFEKGE